MNDTKQTEAVSKASRCCGSEATSQGSAESATRADVTTPCCDPAARAEVGVASSSAATKTPCCGSPAQAEPATAAASVGLPKAEELRVLVRERYGAFAEQSGSSGGCCGSAPGCTTDMGALGYTAADAAAIPEGANLGLGCGNPLSLAGVRAGETVLDLGSGAGIDCFLAARAVGESGKAIGVDMTPAMITRARANAAQVEAKNVEFRLGEIEHLPVGDVSVDLIISNCVINLSPDKPQVFRDAFRVLKSGGRMLVSDLVLRRPISEALQKHVGLYVGCVAGASLKDDYLALMRQAGFRNVEILAENAFTTGQESFPPESLEWEAFDAVLSVKVRAYKP